MAGETVTTTTTAAMPATYTTGAYTTAADVAGRQSYGGSADGLSLLAQRLQALTDDGVKSERNRGRRGARPRQVGGSCRRAGGRRSGRLPRCFQPRCSRRAKRV